MTRCEPFLRWAGGKRQLLPVLLPALPADFDLSKNRFFEPFAGGLALTMALASHPSATNLSPSGRKRGRPIVVNDANAELTATYRVIQNDVEALIGALSILAKDTSADAFYRVRALSPQTDLERASRTIFLNKLAFNGLYRVNGAGGFNVPFGRLANPKVCDEELLRTCNRFFANLEVRTGSFASAVGDAKEGDVVYFDPPYIPLSATASFSKYAQDDFRELDQWALNGVIHGLVKRGVRVMLSNSNTPKTVEIFGSELNLFAVKAHRSIGASAASRVRVEEVVGVSYDTSKATNPDVFTSLRQLSHLPPTTTTSTTSTSTTSTVATGTTSTIESELTAPALASAVALMPPGHQAPLPATLPATLPTPAIPRFVATPYGWRLNMVRVPESAVVPHK